MTVLIALLLAEAATAAAPSGSITVEVTNVRNNHGRVHVDICPQNRFLEDSCPYSGDAPAHAGTVMVVVNGVPAGQFAAQAFHDENANGDIDRAMFGIPKEGVGFSRDARIRFSPPKWRDAVFNHEARPEAIHFALRYFMGPSGPNATRR